ncbi:probable LRR receptor-like serine/threonine-protein kinase At4g29180 [Neltuma alba]|uniref:probable LRR receptor-like serine/threonine-protein kinase At4g29180 n=1 Tax=Neltuma alba TaxID=207710 RepID=UPI0010A5759D|nr:probable LRR receptor-like serine/threonine-protein kinase At4g29180 [Prosopis alba]
MQQTSELRSRAFSHSYVLEITDNLQNLIGEVRHLVSLMGYCEESGVRALIYEYMANGNLHHHLSSNKARELKWKDRLQIALGAAYGLDYLHNGCKPAIVHRDLKASNILLDENMEPKIADFGLSRAFANDIDSHVSTHPAGTFGYLDPQFQNSGNLTKGSDVYSFGIILLELVTRKPAAKRQPNNTFILLLEWVTPKLGSKDIQSIVDPRLQGQYSIESAWKFLEIAKSCTAPIAIQRPDISQVVVDLRECLAMEIRMEGTNHNTNSSSSLDMSANLQFDSSFGAPSAR